MKFLKFVAFLLGGLTAVLAAIAIFLMATFDADRIKSEITRVVKEKKDRNLAIGGAVSLSLWPNVGVRLGNTTLSERGSDKPFAALEGVRIAVAPLPLLSKRLVVDEIQLIGIQASVVRGKDGTFNFDDLFTKDATDAEALRFDIAGVRVKDGQISFRDEAAGRKIDFSEVNLTTGRLGNAAQGPLAATFRLTGDLPRMAAKVSAAGQYRYDLDQKQYALAGLDFKLQGDIADVQGVDAELSAVRLGLKPESSEVELEKLLLKVKGRRADDSFEIQVEAPRLVATASTATGEAVNVTAKLRGKQHSLDSRMNLAAVRGTAQALSIANSKLELDGRFGEGALIGTVSSPLNLNLKAQSIGLPDLSGQLSIAHPKLAAKSVKLDLKGDAQADLLKPSASGNMRARFDESTVQARWQFPRFAPLSMGFEVDIDRIDLDRYLPPAAPEDKSAEAGKPADLSIIKSLDARGTLRIGALKAHNVKATNVKLDLRAAGGRLDFSPLSANLYQGSTSGSVSVDANGNRVAVKQALLGVSVFPLIKAVLAAEVLEGHGNVTLDFTTRGGNANAMRKGVDGIARFALKDGALRGVDLAKLARQSRAGAAPLASAAGFSEAERTEFSTMWASFKIVDGVAHNNDLTLRSPEVSVAGQGSIDLANTAANYIARTSLLPTAKGTQAPPAAAKPVPVKLSGPLEKLSYSIEPKPVDAAPAAAAPAPKSSAVFAPKAPAAAKPVLAKGGGAK